MHHLTLDVSDSKFLINTCTLYNVVVAILNWGGASYKLSSRHLPKEPSCLLRHAIITTWCSSVHRVHFNA